MRVGSEHTLLIKASSQSTFISKSEVAVTEETENTLNLHEESQYDEQECLRQVLRESEGNNVELLLQESQKFDLDENESLRRQKVESLKEFHDNLKKSMSEFNLDQSHRSELSNEEWPLLQELLEQEFRLRPHEEWSHKLMFYLEKIKQGRMVDS